MSELTGRQVGPFRLGRVLGQGGAGTVYLAEAPDGRPVALKLLHSTGQVAASRFLQEARLAADLGLHRFLPLLDSGESPAGPWLATPYCPGGTLADRLLQQGPLPLEEVRGLGTRLGQALAALHARGVIHRDLKPHNVLFDGQGEPWIGDLGLAKYLDRDQAGLSRSLTRTGELQGTFGYAPAEQMLDSKSAGPAADVFALGAVLWECASGRPAFSGASPLEVAQAVERAQVPRLRSLRPETPAAVEALLARCLERDPRLRPGDGGAFCRAWQAAWAGPLARPPRPRLLAGAVLLGGAVVAGAIALASGRPPAPPTASSAAAPPPPSPRPPPPDAPALSRGELPLGSRGLRLLQQLGGEQGKHAAMICALVLAPDGRRVLTADLSGVLSIWDLDASLALVARCVVPGRVHGAIFSRDGARVYAGSDEGVVLWEPEAGRVTPPRGPAYTAPMDELADGSLLLSGPGDWVVRQDPELLTVRQRFRGQLASVAVASGDASRIYGVDQDGELREWRLEDGQLTRQAAWISAHPMQLDLDPTGARLAVTTTAGMLCVWDLRDWRSLLELEVLERERVRGPGHARGLRWSPDGRSIWTGGDDGLLREWSVADGRELRRIEATRSWVERIRILPERDLLLSAGNDGVVDGWNLSDGNPRWPERGHRGRITALAWGGSDRLWSGASDGSLRRWDLARSAVEARGSLGISAASLVGDERQALALGESGAALWARPSEPGRLRVSQVSGSALAVGRTPDGPAALTRREGALIELLPAGEEIQPVQRPFLGEEARAAWFSEDGEEVIALDRSGTLFSSPIDGPPGARRAMPQLPLPGPPRQLDQVVADRGLSVTVCIDSYLGVAREGETLWFSPGVARPPMAMGLSTAGDWVAVLGREGLITITSLRDGHELAALVCGRMDGLARCLAPSPDGRRLAVGTSTGQVLVLELTEPVGR